MVAVPPKAQTPKTNGRSNTATPAKGYKNPLVSPPSTGKPVMAQTSKTTYRPAAPQKKQGAGMKKGGC